jgi:DNA-directed RNA polymerase specialized sigma24 family protein
MVCEKNTPALTQEYLTALYLRAFPGAAALVKKMGGNLEEAKDLFHDAIILYHEKSMAANFLQPENESAYLAGIVKHLWLKRLEANKKDLSLDVNSLAFSEEKTSNISKSLLQYIERSGKKCLDLLTAFYYEQLNMREIATRFGFSGERSATSQKFKCLEKVRDAMRERSLSKEDFYE